MRLTVYSTRPVVGFGRDLPAKKRRVPEYEVPMSLSRLELLAVAFIAMGMSTALIYIGFIQ